MKIRKTTHILLIALVIVIVFSGSLKSNFAWDDKYLITDNPYVKSWSHLSRIFTSHLYEGSEMGSNFYRPLQAVSFAIDYSIWKLNPFGYHLASLLLHIFNSTLVYLIAIAVAAHPYAAFITALLFGIAPAISSTTYYIPARSDLLMAFFVFLSILLFIKYREKEKKIFYVISIVSFALSLLCKEMAVVLPILLVIEIFRQGKRDIKSFKVLLPYLTILLIYIFLRVTILNFAKGVNLFINLGFPSTVPLWERMVTDIKIIPMYLRILLLPFGLHIEWFVKPAKTLFQPDILISMAILIFIILAIKKISRKHKLVLFGSLWFFFGLIPVLNIYPISVFFGEGWLYVPSVGFFIIFGVIFQDIIMPRLGKILSSILIVSFLVYYSLFTISYGKVWKDSVSLYHNVVKYGGANPFIYLTYDNLAMTYYDMGEFEKSIECCRKSIESNARRPEAYNNLGVAYMAMEKPARAIKFFKKAVKLKKDYAPSYCNLGHVYSSIGLKNKAIEISKEAIRIDPRSYKTYCNLGYVYTKIGDVDNAIEVFKKAREFKKYNAEPHYCLGALYIKKDDYKKALEEYAKVLEYKGAVDFNFYNGLALVYLKNSRYRESELALLKSLALNSNQFEPHNNLGNLYSMFGHFSLAIGEYKKALKIAPGNTGILNNIKKTKRQWIQALKNKNARH